MREVQLHESDRAASSYQLSLEPPRQGSVLDLEVPVPLEDLDRVAPLCEEDLQRRRRRGAVRARDGDALEERENRVGLSVGEVREGKNEALLALPSVSMKLTNEVGKATHLGEAGRLGRREAGDECLEQVRQDGAERRRGSADEVQDEVADEKAARLGRARLEEVRDLGEDELEARGPVRVAPARWGQLHFRRCTASQKRRTMRAAGQHPCARRS